MKIDYEITVDVSNESVETKKKVQDAFFKLGLTWLSSGNIYNYLDAPTYTNSYQENFVDSQLMYSRSSRKPTHTIEELFKLVGMENEVKLKTNLKPFDLEKALAGDPVVTLGGRDVSQITLFDSYSPYSLRAVVGGDIRAFTKDGANNILSISSDDLFMKPKTRIINGFEVPSPETKAPNYTTRYYFPRIDEDSFYEWNCWGSCGVDNRILSRNILFLNKADAIANAKAMLGINPYEE